MHTDRIWRRKQLDLSAYAGEPIVFIRFRVIVSHPHDWWRLRNIELKEQEPPPEIVSFGMPISITQEAWHTEGPEIFNEQTGQWEQISGWFVQNQPDLLTLGGDYNHSPQSITYKKGFDFTNAVAPMLYYEEIYNGANRYVDVNLLRATTIRNVHDVN